MKPTPKLPTGVHVYDAAAERLCDMLNVYSCCAIAHAQGRELEEDVFSSSELRLFRRVYGYSPTFILSQDDSEFKLLTRDQRLNLRLIQLAFVRELWRQGYRAEDFS